MIHLRSPPLLSAAVDERQPKPRSLRLNAYSESKQPLERQCGGGREEPALIYLNPKQAPSIAHPTQGQYSAGMTSRVEALVWDTSQRLLGGGGGGEHGEGSGSVHITYEDLYASIMFLTCIYVGGQIAARLLRMPRWVDSSLCCNLAVKPSKAVLVVAMRDLNYPCHSTPPFD